MDLPVRMTHQPSSGPLWPQFDGSRPTFAVPVPSSGLIVGKQEVIHLGVQSSRRGLAARAVRKASACCGQVNRLANRMRRSF